MTEAKQMRAHPVALPHGEIKEIFENIFFVTGTAYLCALSIIPMTMSRNMTIIRYGDALCLVNSIRLNEKGLEDLDRLGMVKHVIRLAGYHGCDDPFYKERYGATVWAPGNAPYFEGFDEKREPYFVADERMNKDTKLPFPNARVILIESGTIREAFLLLERPEGKILVSGDCLQNITKADEYTGLLGRIILSLMGFVKPCNIGPVWYSSSKPDRREVVALLDLKFDHVIPSHGEPVISGAWNKYENVINALK